MSGVFIGPPPSMNGSERAIYVEHTRTPDRVRARNRTHVRLARSQQAINHVTPRRCRFGAQHHSDRARYLGRSQGCPGGWFVSTTASRSEEHTSELQSPVH